MQIDEVIKNILETGHVTTGALAILVIYALYKLWHKYETHLKEAVDKNEEEQKKAFVFTKPDGDHANSSMMYKNYKKIAAAIGAPESRVHDLRHTYAVLSLQNGDDVKTVQENLGHATASFTLDVYGHVSETMKQSSADRMQKYIESIG